LKFFEEKSLLGGGFGTIEKLYRQEESYNPHVSIDSFKKKYILSVYESIYSWGMKVYTFDVKSMYFFVLEG